MANALRRAGYEAPASAIDMARSRGPAVALRSTQTSRLRVRKKSFQT